MPNLDESSGHELARGPGHDMLKSYGVVHAVIKVESRKFHMRFVLMDVRRINLSVSVMEAKATLFASLGEVKCAARRLRGANVEEARALRAHGIGAVGDACLPRRCSRGHEA